MRGHVVLDLRRREHRAQRVVRAGRHHRVVVAPVHEVAGPAIGVVVLDLERDHRLQPAPGPARRVGRRADPEQEIQIVGLGVHDVAHDLDVLEPHPAGVLGQVPRVHRLEERPLGRAVLERSTLAVGLGRLEPLNQRLQVPGLDLDGVEPALDLRGPRVHVGQRRARVRRARRRPRVDVGADVREVLAGGAELVPHRVEPVLDLAEQQGLHVLVQPLNLLAEVLDRGRQRPFDASAAVDRLAALVGLDPGLDHLAPRLDPLVERLGRVQGSLEPASHLRALRHGARPPGRGARGLDLLEDLQPGLGAGRQGDQRFGDGLEDLERLLGLDRLLDLLEVVLGLLLAADAHVLDREHLVEPPADFLDGPPGVAEIAGHRGVGQVLHRAVAHLRHRRLLAAGVRPGVVGVRPVGVGGVVVVAVRVVAGGVVVAAAVVIVLGMVRVRVGHRSVVLGDGQISGSGPEPHAPPNAGRVPAARRPRCVCDRADRSLAPSPPCLLPGDRRHPRASRAPAATAPSGRRRAAAPRG